MSLVNVYMERDRALIGFDTLACHMPIPATISVADASEVARKFDGDAHMSKCGFIACPNVAIASRGDAMAAVLVQQTLQLSMSKDFDALVEILPQALANAYAQATAFRKQRLGIVDDYGVEIVLVGWSPALNRMHGVHWVRWPTGKGFTSSQVGKVLILPDAEWEQTPGVPDTPEKMEAIARDQVAYVRRKYPDHEYDCGGRLLLAELTRDTMSVRVVADLEASPQAQGAGQCLVE